MEQERKIVDSVQRLAVAASRHVTETVPAIIMQRLAETTGQPAPSLSLTECHVIDAIGTAEETKGSDIARSLNLTRGGVSKMLARLEAKGCVLGFAREGNRKERGLSLTPLGKQVFLIHQELHEANVERWASTLDGYSPAQKELLAEMIDQILEEFEAPSTTRR